MFAYEYKHNLKRQRRMASDRDTHQIKAFEERTESRILSCLLPASKIMLYKCPQLPSVKQSRWLVGEEALALQGIPLARLTDLSDSFRERES